MAPAQASIDWADDTANLDEVPKIQTSVDDNGIITTVEYRTDEDGKKIKITRRIRRTLRTAQVSHAVAERKATWEKFGLEKGKKPGPDTGTTTVAENIRVRLIAGNKVSQKEESDDKEKLKQQLEGKKIVCRLCHGNHFTARCPHKETLGGLDGDPDAVDAEADPALAAATAGGTGKYVPPSLRDPANRRAGESMYLRNREDMPTLRVTNLSEDAVEEDLWRLFGRFGRINRIFVGKDQETGLCKGFAFVSFEDRREAEAAISKINGLPYDHLILQCGWSVPRENRDEKRP